MKVILTVHGNERDGEKFEFTEPGSLIFGRSEKAQCRIVNDLYVSRIHFLLLANPPDVRLRNLSRTNGTTVDGKLYVQSAPQGSGSASETLVKGEAGDDPSEAILRDGSEIEVGYTRIAVAIEAEKNVYCGECGSAIPSRQREAARQGQYYLCSDCRETRRRGQEERRRVAQHPPQALRPVAGRQRGGPIAPTPRGLGVLEGEILRRLRLRGPKGVPPSVPGYEVIRKLGEGGMGLVFEAKRLRDAHRVAIKIVKPDLPITKERKSRFRREIRMTRELDHPHIIEFIEGNEFSGLLWFAMEYVEDGYDIAKHIKKHRGRIPVQEAVKLVLQALDALDYAYRAKGVIHRDIKPPNVFLIKRENAYTVKVSDFGLAKSLESSGLNGSVLTQPGLCMGTLPYMPPEQVIDVRSAKPSADVFAMGATLYQMLTGRYIRDFRFDHRLHQSEEIRQVVDEPVIPIRTRDRSVPARLAAIIDKSLELDPRDRYADAHEFKAALRPAVP